MYDRYARQALFHGIGEAGQKKLSEKSVAIVGCGALGCLSANLLVRSGIKRLVIIDRDYIEENNLQRQTLFDEADIRDNLPKAVAAQKKLQKVNSLIRIDSSIADLNPSTIETNLFGADIIIDGTDNFETRFLINDYCIKNTIPWIYGACVGSSGLTMNIIPGKSPCIRCVLNDIPASGTTETCDTEGILSSVASIIASFQAAEALKILTNNWHVLNRNLIQIDIWRNEIRKISVDGMQETTNCVTCKQHHYEFLSTEKQSLATTLCGRNAIQISHLNGSSALDLQKLGSRLKKVGSVTTNPYLLRCKVGKYELTIFADGRSIISGTNDISVAKGIYAKYIGM